MQTAFAKAAVAPGMKLPRWMYYSDVERLHLMNDVLPQRTPLATDP